MNSLPVLLKVFLVFQVGPKEDFGWTQLDYRGDNAKYEAAYRELDKNFKVENPKLIFFLKSLERKGRNPKDDISRYEYVSSQMRLYHLAETDEATYNRVFKGIQILQRREWLHILNSNPKGIPNNLAYGKLMLAVCADNYVTNKKQRALVVQAGLRLLELQPENLRTAYSIWKLVRYFDNDGDMETMDRMSNILQKDKSYAAYDLHADFLVSKFSYTGRQEDGNEAMTRLNAAIRKSSGRLLEALVRQKLILKDMARARQVELVDKG